MVISSSVSISMIYKISLMAIMLLNTKNLHNLDKLIIGLQQSLCSQAAEDLGPAIATTTLAVGLHTITSSQPSVRCSCGRRHVNS